MCAAHSASAVSCNVDASSVYILEYRDEGILSRSCYSPSLGGKSPDNIASDMSLCELGDQPYEGTEVWNHSSKRSVLLGFGVSYIIS